MVGLFEEKSQNLEEENIYLRKVLIDIYDAMVDSIKIIKKQVSSIKKIFSNKFKITYT